MKLWLSNCNFKLELNFVKAALVKYMKIDRYYFIENFKLSTNTHIQFSQQVTLCKKISKIFKKTETLAKNTHVRPSQCKCVCVRYNGIYLNGFRFLLCCARIIVKTIFRAINYATHACIHPHTNIYIIYILQTHT